MNPSFNDISNTFAFLEANQHFDQYYETPESRQFIASYHSPSFDQAREEIKLISDAYAGNKSSPETPSYFENVSPQPMENNEIVKLIENDSNSFAEAAIKELQKELSILSDVST